jgi:hypothetical protein
MADRPQKITFGEGDSMPIPVKIATVRIDGVAYEGIYYVQGSTVFVESPFGAKALQVGKLPPEAVAKMLLSELVRASHSTD